MAYARVCFVIFGFLAISIVSIALILDLQRIDHMNRNSTTWHLDRWYAVKWNTRRPKYRNFELHLLPPPTLDCQAKMVFLRDRIKDRIPAGRGGSTYRITFNGQRRNYDVACCFTYATVFDSLLDFDINDMFVGNDSVSIVYFDIYLK